MIKSTTLSIFILFYVIRIIQSELIIKPAKTTVLRDQYQAFIALCTGRINTRVVSWQSPSQIDIKENNRERITVERRSSGLRLRIRNLTEDDQGTWKCFGLDEVDRSIAQNLQINVKSPITFISESIQYVELDSTALIECRVRANPSAEISWFKGEEKIDLISSNYEQRNEGLKINRVSSIDNDIFWCQADVIETGESKEYQIQVLIAQSIMSTKVMCLTPCAVEKRTATLICEANGSPTPQYSWSYGQNSLPLVDGTSKFIVRGNRLIINYVDQTDNGRYTCHAFNDYDQKGQKKDYSLNVIIPPVLSAIPQIEMSIDENTPSRQISFSCHLERGTTENLSLEWFYANDTAIQSSNDVSINTSNRLSELIIKSVRREHHGNYTCVAKNSADTRSTVARLFVQYKPIYIGPHLDETYSVPEHSVIMKCQFDSYPPPVLQWLKVIREYNQIVLKNDDPQVIEILTRQIGPTIYETELMYDPSDDDFGLKFECRANNSRIEKHFLTLRLAQPPGEPRIYEIKLTLNSVELKVQPPSESGGLPLLQYIVKYDQVDVLDSTKMIYFPVTSNGSQSIRVQFLRAGSLYRFQIAVKTQAGQSGFSIPRQANMSSGGVPKFSIANDLCLVNSCYIKWFLEDDGGSTISKAEISYAEIRRNGKVEEMSKPILIDTQTSEYVLEGLKPNTDYSIILRLFNTAGHDKREIRRTTNAASETKENHAPRFSIIFTIIVGIFVGMILVLICMIFIRK